MTDKILTVGLTGQSGAGKTEFSALLAARSIPVFNCDREYAALLVPPSECLDALKKEFGDGVISADGSLDRRALASLVFEKSPAGQERLEKLNKITHAFILARCREYTAEKAKEGYKCVVVDAPVLFESGFDSECGLIVSVVARVQNRVERIVRRDGISPSDALARIDAQHGDLFYASRSDIVVHNDGGMDELRSAADRLAAILLN